MAPGDIGDITAPSSSPSNSPTAEPGAKSGRPDPGAHPPVFGGTWGVGRPAHRLVQAATTRGTTHLVADPDAVTHPRSTAVRCVVWQPDCPLPTAHLPDAAQGLRSAQQGVHTAAGRLGAPARGVADRVGSPPDLAGVVPARPVLGADRRAGRPARGAHRRLLDRHRPRQAVDRGPDRLLRCPATGTWTFPARATGARDVARGGG